MTDQGKMIEALAEAAKTQFTAANQRAAAALDRIKAQARADGYAEGVRDAANALKTEYRISSFWLNGFEVFGSEAATPAACYRTILALRDKPAETAPQPDLCSTSEPQTAPAVTVREAARVLLSDADAVLDLSIEIMRNRTPNNGNVMGYQPAVVAALRAIAGGGDE